MRQTLETASSPIVASSMVALPAGVLTLLTPAVAVLSLRALIPSSVITPVVVTRLAALLCHHPDQSFATFVLEGFAFRFSLGVHGLIRSGPLPNLALTRLNPGEVSRAVAKEVSGSHSHGPFPLLSFVSFLVSKKTGDFILILDLSVNH